MLDLKEGSLRNDLTLIAAYLFFKIASQSYTQEGGKAIEMDLKFILFKTVYTNNF